MARVYTVQKARKARPEHGIEVGDKYYYWGFQFGPMHYSKTYPKPWQLTQSPFLQTLYQLQHRVETTEDADDRDDIVAEIEALRDECESSLENIPESLKYAPSGELLQERIDALEQWISELEQIDTEDEDAVEQIQNCSCEL